MSDNDRDNLMRHHRELAEALQTLFRAGRVEELTPELDKRRRHIVAQRLIASFVKRTGIGNDIAKEFGDLAGIFSDLDKGRRNPVVTPAQGGGGRPPDRYYAWKVRANVVFGFEALTSTGLTEDEAAEYIAVHYPDLERVKHNRMDELKNSILSWHGHFQAKTAGDAEIQDAFTYHHPLFLQELKARSIEDRRKLADDLLSAALREAEEMIE